MKTTFIFAVTLAASVVLFASPVPAAHAADQEAPPKSERPGPAGETPAMSEIPTMKEQGKRMATLMEQLSRESNPEIRRRIMAEAMCPQ